MASFSAWAYGVANDLRKPLDKTAYRVLGVVAALVALSAAIIGFMSEPRWEFALLCVLLSLPGGLLAGMLYVLRHQRHGATSKRDKKASLAMLVAFGAMIGLAYAVPSDSDQLIIIMIAVAVITIARPSTFGNFSRLQRDAARPRRDIRWTIASLAILLVTFGVLIGLHYAMPSALGQIIVVAVALAVITIARPSRSGHGEF